MAPDRKMLNVTGHLAEFAAGLNENSLPAEVRHCLISLLIDFFRVASLGAKLPWTGKVKRAFEQVGGLPTASILYSDEKTDIVHAAFINGVIAGSLEWDDTHVGAMLHPGVVVWPAALAVGEILGSSRAEVLSAVAAGYETMIRIGLAIQPSHFRRGFQSTATCGVFGSAVAAAKLLGLDSRGIYDAINLAANRASGVTQFFLSGSEVKRLHAGKASAAGVEAALLVRAGFHATSADLGSPRGFASALADAFDPAAIEDGLGKEFHILRLQMKPHAVSARVLAAIEAAEQLLQQSVDPNQIEAVEIGVPKVIVGRLTNNAPADLQQAQMSAPFAVAMAFVLGSERSPPLVIGIDDCQIALGRPQIRDLSRRTSFVIDPEIERTSNSEYVSARVTVTLVDGRQFSATVDAPLGCADRPMSVADLRERFRSVLNSRISDNMLDGWIAGLEADATSKSWATQVLSLRMENNMNELG